MPLNTHPVGQEPTEVRTSKFSDFKRLSMRRGANSWVLRGLGVGAVATLLDLSLGLGLVAMQAPTRAAAMAGTLSGAAFTFVLNRLFTFRDSAQGLWGAAFKFALVTAATSTVHGQVVVFLRDAQAIPYPVAKILADLLVLTFSQLLLLRYVVFPKSE
jgi:putative flippase GtrA